MQEHCYHGYEILKKIPFLGEAAEIVYSHQEKYDGTGYPRGLKGEEIPLGARMFSVADTLDAITSDRPYRPAQSLTAAREEIELLVGAAVRSQSGQSFPRHGRKISGLICARKSTPRYNASLTPQLPRAPLDSQYPQLSFQPQKLLNRKADAKDAKNSLSKPAFRFADSVR